MTLQCEKIEVNEDGWCDWLAPNPDRYLMQCCDCGLIHEMQFMAVRAIGEPDAEGLYESESMEDGRAVFRAKRYPDSPAPFLDTTVENLITDLLGICVVGEDGELTPSDTAIQAVALIRSLTGDSA